MKQLVIRDSDENLIAKVSKVLSCSAEDTLANAKTLSFTTLLEDGADPQSGGVLFLFSNSGRNTVPVDMAVEAKKRGVTVICITNLNHSRSVASRHPSGKKLYEVCDIVIDNCGAIGDAAIDVGGLVCGPTSTVVGAAILQSIVCGAVLRIQSAGLKPEVFSSSNVDGGDAINEAYIQKYRSRIRML